LELLVVEISPLHDASALLQDAELLEDLRTAAGRGVAARRLRAAAGHRAESLQDAFAPLQDRTSLQDTSAPLQDATLEHDPFAPLQDALFFHFPPTTFFEHCLSIFGLVQPS
jgi:hypothetical protein